MNRPSTIAYDLSYRLPFPGGLQLSIEISESGVVVVDAARETNESCVFRASLDLLQLDLHGLALRNAVYGTQLAMLTWLTVMGHFDLAIGGTHAESYAARLCGQSYLAAFSRRLERLIVYRGELLEAHAETLTSSLDAILALKEISDQRVDHALFTLVNARHPQLVRTAVLARAATAVAVSKRRSR